MRKKTKNCMRNCWIQRNNWPLHQDLTHYYLRRCKKCRNCDEDEQFKQCRNYWTEKNILHSNREEKPILMKKEIYYRYLLFRKNEYY